jgi:pyrophosphatase PpaX
VKVVLFDLDGTLVDSMRLYAACYSRAFEELPEPPTLADMAARKPASERHFLLEWLGEELGHRVHARMCDAYDELAESMLSGFYAGVPEMLDALAARGVKMGVVTGKSRRAYEATRRCLSLERWFDVVVLEDDVPAPKPDPRGLVLALDKLAARASDALYVGDLPIDVEAAQRAGMIGASALWRYSEGERARFVKDDAWILESPSDLLSRLTRDPRA